LIKKRVKSKGNPIITRSKYEPFELYLYDVSYFSGKLEMYMRYKGIPFKRVEALNSQKVSIFLKNTGLVKVPIVKAANGEWLKDTTPMIDWFESQYPESHVVPEDPALMFISKLVEDYADEWLMNSSCH